MGEASNGICFGTSRDGVYIVYLGAEFIGKTERIGDGRWKFVNAEMTHTGHRPTRRKAAARLKQLHEGKP